MSEDDVKGIPGMAVAMNALLLTGLVAILLGHGAFGFGILTGAAGIAIYDYGGKYVRT